MQILHFLTGFHVQHQRLSFPWMSEMWFVSVFVSVTDPNNATAQLMNVTSNRKPGCSQKRSLEWQESLHIVSGNALNPADTYFRTVDLSWNLFLLFFHLMSHFDFHLTFTCHLMTLPPPSYLLRYLQTLGFPQSRHLSQVICAPLAFPPSLLISLHLSLKHSGFLCISLLHPVRSLAPFCLFSNFAAFSHLFKPQLKSSFLSFTASCFSTPLIRKGMGIKYTLVLLLICDVWLIPCYSGNCYGVLNIWQRV